MPQCPARSATAAGLDLITSAPARAACWLALLGVTGFLVRAESRRPDLPPGVRRAADLVYRDADGRRPRLDVYRPESPPPATGYPVLLAIHGGGWRGGSKGDYGRSLLPLVGKGVAVVAVDYLLARPGAVPWPENLDDVRASLRWVRDNAAAYQLDPGRVALIGASAGAHLALCTAYPAPGGEPTPDADGDEGRGMAGEPPIRAVIDFYGPADLAPLHATSPGAAGPVEGLLGGPPDHLAALYESASPTRRIRPGGPPVLILHGADDLLVPPEQSLGLAGALGRRGVRHTLVIVEGARHGFGLHAGTRDFVPTILEFLGGAWEDKTSPPTSPRRRASND